MNSLFESSSIPLLQEVASFSQARHAVLAGNFANMETPGYQVRDLSVETFQQRLREAIELRDVKSYGATYEGGPGDPIRNVSESMEAILYHDGTNVGLEEQVTEMAKNQFMHNLALSIMSSQFQLLQAAISERV